MTTRSCPCGTPLYWRNKTGKCRSCANKGRPSTQAWPEAEAERLKQLYPKLGMRCLDQFPGRTKEALASKARQLGLKFEGRQVPHNKGKGKVRPPRDATEHMQRVVRRQQDMAKRNLEKAIGMVERGVTTSPHGQTRMALITATRVVEEQRRRECPVEQAKTVLRAERIVPVVAMAFTERGGPSNLYQIGSMLNVSEADLLALAAKIQARRMAA